MAATFDIKGKIDAAVSSGSLSMLRKLQLELKKTAMALSKMGEASAATAVGHMSMAIGKVTGAAKGAAAATGALAGSVANTTKAMTKAQAASKRQADIVKDVGEGWKLNAVEAKQLEKAVGLLGKKYTYAANTQKEWVPALKSSLTEINKQKAALVASGKAITTHVTSTELFDRTNRRLATGMGKVGSSLTQYGKAMEESLGRSKSFRGEVTQLSKSFGVQGKAFESQYSALKKVDDVWRNHVTTLHKAGKITTETAKSMYDSYSHFGASAKELQARIKASNGELMNAATYNKAAREEIKTHTAAMKELNTAEEKLAKVTGKSVKSIQGETEALMKRTKSYDATLGAINKQVDAYQKMDKQQAAVIKKEQALATATGARVTKIQEITKRMKDQGASYEDVGRHLDSLKKKHADSVAGMGRVSKASHELQRSNKELANEINALGRIRQKNLTATKATATSLEGLARKYPKLSKQVEYFSNKIAQGNTNIATADKVLKKMSLGMGHAEKQAGMFSRAMGSLVQNLKSFTSYIAAASIIGGIAMIFSKATAAVVGYDQALHDLQAITQATDAETAAMGEKIREVGRTTKFSAIEVAAAMKTLGQAGFTASEAIGSIDAFANLATGTLTDMNTVVDLGTTAIRAFGLEASDSTRVSDVFANAVNRSKLTIDKLRVAFNYIGPIAAKAGLSLEEASTASMMLANSGLRASTIGTGLRRTLQMLIDPSEELKKAITAAGYSVQDLNPQMNDMRTIIRRLSEVVPDAEAAFKMFGLRASSVVAALSSQGVGAFDALSSSVNRSGSAAEMAEKQLEGLGLIFKQVADKCVDLALGFGESGATGGLRILGKTLQVVLDGLIAFVNSGILKAVGAIGLLSGALYGVVVVWGKLKFAVWTTAVINFTFSLWEAAAAGKALSFIGGKLSKSFVLLTIAAAALYTTYKALTESEKGYVEVNLKYLDTLDKTHAKEKKRLEGIENLVSAVRDEMDSDRNRSAALIKLQDQMAGLNLEIDEETSLVKNLNDVVAKNASRFDEAAAAVGNYADQIAAEKLEGSVKAYLELDKAMGKQSASLRQCTAAAEKMNNIDNLVLGNLTEWALRTKGQAENLKKLGDQHTEAYGKIQKAVGQLVGVTQDTWTEYMRIAGASIDEIVKYSTDGDAKIGAEHVRALFKARGFQEDHTNFIVGEFNKVHNAKAAALEKELKIVRKFYSDQGEAASGQYNAVILEMQTYGQATSDVYAEILQVVTRKSIERERAVRHSYQKEKELIIDAGLTATREIEKLAELDKKYANQKVVLAKETAEEISKYTGLRLEAHKKEHEELSAANEAATERWKATLTDYYDWKATRATQDITDQQALQAELLNIGQEKYDEFKAVHDAFLVDQLAAEVTYAAEQRAMIEKDKAQNLIVFANDAEERLKIEKELNQKLIELNTESLEKQKEIKTKAIKNQLTRLTEWRDELRASYSQAKDFAQSYADKVKEIEIEITNLRKSEAEKLAGIIETTEDRIITARRAGMSEAMIVIDKMAEARRKAAEADRLVAEGTTESLEKAKALYMEAQGIWAGLATQANAAAKEGKDIGVSYDTAMGQVVTAGEKAQGAVRDYTALQVTQKEAEKSAAEASKQHWETVATAIETTLTKVATAIDKLTAALNTLQGIEITPTINTQSLDEAGRKSGETKQALEDIGNAHVAPTVETADLDRAAESGRVLHTSLDDIPGHVAISVDGRELKITSDAAGKLDIDLEGVALPRVVDLDSTKLGVAEEEGKKLKEALDSVTDEERVIKIDSSETREAAEKADELALAQASANDVLDQTEEIAEEVSAATADYSGELDTARNKTEELSKVGEDGIAVTSDQIKSAEEHSKALGDKSKKLTDIAKTEKDALKVSKEALKASQARLVAARERLAQLLQSKTATKEELEAAKQNVLEQQKMVVAAKENVEAQKQVAAEALKAADAFEKESAAADKVAGSLGGVSSAAAGAGAAMGGASEAANSFSFSVKATAGSTDFFGNKIKDMGNSADDSGDALSRLGESAERFGERLTSSMQLVRESLISGEDISELERLNMTLHAAGETGLDLVTIFEQMDLSFTDSEESMGRVSEMLATGFEDLVQSGDRARESIVQLIDEAVRIETATVKMEEFSAEVDNSYQEAAESARRFGGAAAETADEIMNMVTAAERTRDSIEYLNEEDLEDLQDAIEASRDKLVELTEEAQKASDKLATIGEKLRNQLDRELGNLEAIERRRYDAQIKEIEELFAASGQTGEARARYMEDLALAEQLHQAKMADVYEKRAKEEGIDVELYTKRLESEGKLQDTKLTNLGKLHMKQSEFMETEKTYQTETLGFADKFLDKVTGIKDQFTGAHEKMRDMSRESLEKATQQEVIWKRISERMDRARVPGFGTNIPEGMKFAEGGPVPGVGLGDKVRAMLTPGEFVIDKEATSKFGAGFFSLFNKSTKKDNGPGYAKGGLVDDRFPLADIKALLLSEGSFASGAEEKIKALLSSDRFADKGGFVPGAEEKMRAREEITVNIKTDNGAALGVFEASQAKQFINLLELEGLRAA